MRCRCGFLSICFQCVSSHLIFIKSAMHAQHSNHATRNISKHNNPDTVHLRLIDLVVLINAAAELGSPPVEQIKVELAVTGLEFLVLEEERVVQKRQGVEDVEAVVLGQDQNVVDEGVEAGFEAFLDFVGGAGGEGCFRGVVVEVRGADCFGCGCF
jgi:hypothetical protein